MSKHTDVKVVAAQLYFLPVEMRMPLKFGAQVVNGLTCARVRVVVEDLSGAKAEGWGETPLSVAWVWPGELSWKDREERLRNFCRRLVEEVVAFSAMGHPLELGHRFQRERLGAILSEHNAGYGSQDQMPHLAALVCHSLFDVATYDAFGQLNRVPVFETFTPQFLQSDLSAFLEPAASFAGKWPCEYLVERQDAVPVWHLVGGLDPIFEEELTGSEPSDGHPVLLRDWIRADGLRCLKIKLRGNDAVWDYERVLRVGQIAIAEGGQWLSADFNCTVTDPNYVNAILDRLLVEAPSVYEMLLYVEQPFPYDLEAHRIEVHSVSARKPLFLDESAHDWTLVRLGRSLGWTGVALKTCKSLSGAVLSLCWAKEHGMTVMVQDLTNPMLAQIPHLLLAAHAGTIMGVESNAPQFYPDASALEAQVHPGVYRRRNGHLDLSTLQGPGFGYAVDRIGRPLQADAQ